MRGHRHDDCIRTAIKMHLNPIKDDANSQGFMTSYGRYVDRHEGMKIQKASGVNSERLRGKVLFSEDLY